MSKAKQGTTFDWSALIPKTFPVPLAELNPYENNPRINKRAIPYVKRSIKRFGFIVPIVIDSKTSRVIAAGHTRLAAALQLCEEEGKDPAKVKVLCLSAEHLTPSQVRQFRLADNRVARFSEDDAEKLKRELEDLMDDWDAGEFGFDDDDWGDDEDEGGGQTDPDDAPDVPEEPVSKRGEVYQCGKHRLMCGDSTSAADVTRLMDGKKADMVFTDPPYGMNLDTDYSSMQNHLDFAKEKGFTGGKKYDAGCVDDFHPEMVQAAINIGAKETFLWGADYYADLLPNRNNGSWIVWDKRSNNTDDIEADESSDKMYGSCFELCWSKTKHKRDIARVKWAGVFGTEQEFDHKRHHPTQKPVKLSGWFISRYSKEGDIVADLFGGSGSTMIASEQLGRKALLMELDPHYCDVIRKRWAEFKYGEGCDWEELTPKLDGTPSTPMRATSSGN